jgi:hypothetical protein
MAQTNRLPQQAVVRLRLAMHSHSPKRTCYLAPKSSSRVCWFECCCGLSDLSLSLAVCCSEKRKKSSSDGASASDGAGGAKKPAKKRVKASAGRGGGGDDGKDNDASAGDGKAKRKAKPRVYVPKHRSGAYAILVGMGSALLPNPATGEGGVESRGRDWLSRSEVISAAAPHSDTSFEAVGEMRYSAWSAMKYAHMICPLLSPLPMACV